MYFYYLVKGTMSSFGVMRTSTAHSVQNLRLYLLANFCFIYLQTLEATVWTRDLVNWLSKCFRALSMLCNSWWSWYAKLCTCAKYLHWKQSSRHGAAANSSQFLVFKHLLWGGRSYRRSVLRQPSLQYRLLFDVNFINLENAHVLVCRITHYTTALYI